MVSMCEKVIHILCSGDNELRQRVSLFAQHWHAILRIKSETLRATEHAPYPDHLR
jgi:hypothetical protein